MELRFDRIALIELGRPVLDLADKQKARFVVQFDYGIGDYIPRLEVNVIVDQTPEATMSGIRKQAQEQAILIIKATLDLIESHSFEDLQIIQTAQDDAWDADEDNRLRSMID